MKTPSKSTVSKATRMQKFLLPCLTATTLMLGFLCFFSALWYARTFGMTGFDSVLYTLSAGFGGVQSELMMSYLMTGALPGVLCAGLAAFLFLFPWKRPALRIRAVQLFPLKRGVSATIGLVLSLALLLHAAFQTGLVDFLLHRTQSSQLYQQEYRDPDQTVITFPEEKRNLVYIILESMETSYLSQELGGALEDNLIPELYTLALENTNFSHNDAVGGFSQISGASWTIGSMVAQTGGVPLVTPSGITDTQNGYGKNGSFLPGLTTLQSILQDNGYYQALMVGSDARYGGRKTYYTTHGTDDIFDLFTARTDGLIAKDYFKWWGYEDRYLFDYAKEKLTEMSQTGQPFAFTMLTADTHHVGGCRCTLCGRQYKQNYSNVIACSSSQVAAFVQWLTEQPFYENTTVVLVGDHESMDAGYFERNVDSGYQRYIYNCFINAAVETDNSKNRQFTALDMFPTTLAALGCTIEGDRLGLGVNLFSGLPTLTESMGYEALNEELSKHSGFYSRFYY